MAARFDAARSPRDAEACEDILPAYVPARVQLPEDLAGLRIPLKIYTTMIDRKVHCDVWKAQMSLIADNPEFEYFYFDDVAQENYIRTRCTVDGVYEAWKRMRHGAGRKSIFAYCIMYQEGGLFFDVESAPLKPLRSLLRKDDTLVTWYLAGPHIAVAGHPIYRRALNESIYRVTNALPYCNTSNLNCWTALAFCIAIREELGLSVDWKDGYLAQPNVLLHYCAMPTETDSTYISPGGISIRVARDFMNNLIHVNWKDILKKSGGEDHRDLKKPILLGADELERVDAGGILR